MSAVHRASLRQGLGVGIRLARFVTSVAPSDASIGCSSIANSKLEMSGVEKAKNQRGFPGRLQFLEVPATFPDATPLATLSIQSLLQRWRAVHLNRSKFAILIGGDDYRVSLPRFQ